MQAHDHAPSAHGGHAAHAPARDPDFDWWLGATVLFLAVLTAVFVLPATHAAGPATPERPLAPEPGHVGNFGHRVAEVEASRGGEHVSTRQSADQQRLAELYGALAGGGEADDSVPPEVNAEIAWLIKHVAESGHTFTRDGEEHDALDTASSMLERWEKANEPIYSAESFIRKVAGFKLVDQKLNRVRFHGGAERPLNLWLQEEITAYRKGH
jgi:Family of unknown function (DUF5329)